MYRFFDFLDTFLERVRFLGFCKHVVLIVMGLVYFGQDEVVADVALSVSGRGTPNAHKWWSGAGGSRLAGNRDRLRRSNVR